MNNFNCVGRLVRDIEINNYNGTIVGKSGIAVNRKFVKEGKQDVDFINFTIFGKQAETLEKYVKKGQQVALSGRIQIDRYMNKEGKEASSTYMLVDEFTFLPNRDNSDNNSSNSINNNNSINSSDDTLYVVENIEEESDLPF